MPFDSTPGLAFVPVVEETPIEEKGKARRKTSALHAFGTGRRARASFEAKTDTRRRKSLKEVAKTLPKAPGVYFFFGLNDRLLYIGKSKCLRDRVRSYFGETARRRPPKLRRLLAEVKRLEWRECGSELEALLVERRLIAERLPAMNRQHKRFKVYPYLLLSDEAFPRLAITRAEPNEDSGPLKHEFDGFSPRRAIAPESMPLETPPRAGELPGLYLGPFTSPRSAAWTFEAVRALFPLRSCEGAIRPDIDARSCFYHEIGRCCGPCVGATPQQQYARICADLVQLLQSGQAPQLDELRARMKRLSDEWRFEDALELREQLTAIEAVAARLQRLQRMRTQNNVLIVQPAAPSSDAPPIESAVATSSKRAFAPRMSTHLAADNPITTTRAANRHEKTSSPRMSTHAAADNPIATAQAATAQAATAQAATAQAATAQAATAQIVNATVQNVKMSVDGDVAREGDVAQAKSARDASVFLVCGGLVRRHLVVRDWDGEERVLKNAMFEVFGASPDRQKPPALFTAKTELDEMMILDRWLRTNGTNACCIWMNAADRASRQWSSLALRKLKAAARNQEATAR